MHKISLNKPLTYSDEKAFDRMFSSGNGYKTSPDGKTITFNKFPSVNAESYFKNRWMPSIQSRGGSYREI